MPRRRGDEGPLPKVSYRSSRSRGGYTCARLGHVSPSRPLPHLYTCTEKSPTGVLRRKRQREGREEEEVTKRGHGEGVVDDKEGTGRQERRQSQTKGHTHLHGSLCLRHVPLGYFDAT